MPDSPVDDIRRKYDELVEPRQDYLEWAQQAADLTLPSLRPKGEKVCDRPYTQLGTQAVRSITSAVMESNMPSQVKWLKLGADPGVLDRLEDKQVQDKQGNTVDAVTALESRLSVIENYIVDTIAAFKTRSRLSSMMRRNMVEGNTLVHVTKEGIRSFPLRSFVAFRDAGTPRFAIAKEDSIGNAYEAPVDREGTTHVGRDAGRSYLYTLIDYDGDTVWQQVDNEPPEEVGEKPVQWFIVVPSIPDVEHYATSYTYDHLGLIAEINHLSERLGEAAAAAAWNVPVVRPGSPVSANDLKDWPSGCPLDCDPENLSWYTSGTKIGDWAFVAQYRAQLREELSHLFALGIADRARNANTATEVLEIVSDLDRQTQDMMAGVEETFQRSFVEAIMYVRGYGDLKMDNGEDGVKVIITTGQSALARETGFTRMVNTATAVRQLDPLMGVDGTKIMDAASDAMQFDVPDGAFYNASQPEGGGGAPGQTVPLREDGETFMTAGGPQRSGGGPQP